MPPFIIGFKMPLAIAPPSTDIEVISQACVLCGKQPFNTLDGGGAMAQAAAQIYGTLVSAELGSTRWRFALEAHPMGILTTLTPEFEGWRYYWDMPADMLMLHRIDPMVPYTVFGRRIVTTTSTSLTAIYSKNVPVTRWPPAFTMYIIHAIAMSVGASVANSDRLLTRIGVDLKRWESRALFADSQNSPSRLLRYVPWINARYDRGSR